MPYYSDPNPHSEDPEERQAYHDKNLAIHDYLEDQKRQRQGARQPKNTPTSIGLDGMSDSEFVHNLMLVAALISLGPLLLIPSRIGRTTVWHFVMRIWSPIAKLILLIFAGLVIAGVIYYFMSGGTLGAFLIGAAVLLFFLGFTFFEGIYIAVTGFPAFVVSAPFGIAWGLTAGATIAFLYGSQPVLGNWVPAVTFQAGLVGGISGGYFLFQNYENPDW